MREKLIKKDSKSKYINGLNIKNGCFWIIYGLNGK